MCRAALLTGGGSNFLIKECIGQGYLLGDSILPADQTVSVCLRFKQSFLVSHTYQLPMQGTLLRYQKDPKEDQYVP